MADNSSGATLARRRPLDGLPGIYYRPRRDGKVGPPYEFRYLDTEGRRRWCVVRGSVAAAVATRRSIRAAGVAPRRGDWGERLFTDVAGEWTSVLGVCGR